MLITNVVTQPAGQTNLQTLASVAQSGVFSRFYVAAAYVTVGGARDLVGALRESMGGRWNGVEKRWIFAFDYCRSEPLALQMVLAESRSSVRILDGWQLISTGCVPRVPFHPKAFIFGARSHQVLFAGSGNVSRSGLNTGHEVGLLLGFENPANASEVHARRQIQQVNRWYDSIWQSADPLTPELLAAYSGVFESQANRQRPMPTEDDVSPPASANGLTAAQLVQLRVCKNFWIEAGNITRNLGPGVPGNQLMMKKMSRVFFGVPVTNVPHNSPLRTIAITYDGATKLDCSLTFSDNSMDKLTLPLPGNGGPAAYDQETLLFTRTHAGSFDLQIATPDRKQAWAEASRAIGAINTMPSGRRWGVF